MVRDRKKIKSKYPYHIGEGFKSNNIEMGLKSSVSRLYLHLTVTRSDKDVLFAYIRKFGKARSTVAFTTPPNKTGVDSTLP